VPVDGSNIGDAIDPSPVNETFDELVRTLSAAEKVFFGRRVKINERSV
jgi:hypothetical protein